MRRAGAATVALIALAVAGCGGDEGPKTFDRDEFPFTFEYPGDFELTEEVEFDQSLGAASDEDLALAIDEDNLIVLQRITLNLEVTEKNLPVAKEELDGLLAQLDPAAPQGTTGETAGFPSLEYEPVAIDDPAEGESQLLVLFDGDQEYVLNCQSTPDEREQVDEACAEMRETLAPAE